MSKSSLHTNLKPFKEFVLRAKELTNKRVQVGVFDPVIALYALFNEYGAPAANVPPRPFLRATFAIRRDEIARFQAEMVKRVLAGRLRPDTARRKIGEYLVSLVKEQIVKYGPFTFLPLRPATIRKKGGRTEPLIDSEHLLNAITYRIIVVA
jgi:hypothetical protein